MKRLKMEVYYLGGNCHVEDDEWVDFNDFKKSIEEYGGFFTTYMNKETFIPYSNIDYITIEEYDDTD